MTEFIPLAEAAVSANLLLFLGLPTAFRTPGFGQELGHQSKTVGLFLAYMAAWIAGKTLGIGARIGSSLAWGAYIMASLWSSRAARLPMSWRKSLIDCFERQFYQPQHAA